MIIKATLGMDETPVLLNLQSIVRLEQHLNFTNVVTTRDIFEVKEPMEHFEAYFQRIGVLEDLTLATNIEELDALEDMEKIKNLEAAVIHHKD